MVTIFMVICQEVHQVEFCLLALGNVPLDFDTLHEYDCFIGSAAIVILSDKVNMKEIGLNLMKFLKMKVVVNVLLAGMEPQWQ